MFVCFKGWSPTGLNDLDILLLAHELKSPFMIAPRCIRVLVIKCKRCNLMPSISLSVTQRRTFSTIHHASPQEGHWSNGRQSALGTCLRIRLFQHRGHNYGPDWSIQTSLHKSRLKARSSHACALSALLGRPRSHHSKQSGRVPMLIPATPGSLMACSYHLEWLPLYQMGIGEIYENRPDTSSHLAISDA